MVKTIGDAVMATFPTPDRALRAAMRMREAMRKINEERGSEDLALNIGLHSGPCLAVMLDDRQDYFGQTVNIASRVQGLAEPDRDPGDQADRRKLGGGAPAHRIELSHDAAAVEAAGVERSVRDLRGSRTRDRGGGVSPATVASAELRRRVKRPSAFREQPSHA